MVSVVKSSRQDTSSIPTIMAQFEARRYDVVASVGRVQVTIGICHGCVRPTDRDGARLARRYGDAYHRHDFLMSLAWRLLGDKKFHPEAIAPAFPQFRMPSGPRRL